MRGAVSTPRADSPPRVGHAHAGLMSDASPIAALYRRHGAGVFRRARQLLGTDADAYEVVQDVFVMLLEKPEQFEGKSSMTTYLYSMTTHACLNWIRNLKNRARLRRENLEPADEQQRVLTPEQRLLLHDALCQMPDDLAQAAIYHLVDGLPHGEIALLLGCSRRHVGNLLERVRQWGRAEEEVSPC